MHKYLLLIMLLVSAWSVVAETPEQKEKVAEHWSLMSKIAQGQLKPVTFVGRVIDQVGNPVVGAKMFVDAGGNYLAAGSGTRFITTDENGFFEVADLKGTDLALGDGKKDGYEIHVKTPLGAREGEELVWPHFYAYKAYNNALLWEDYTHEHPYVIKAWKVEKYAQVASSEDDLGFKPDGRVYKLDLLKSPIDYGSKLQGGDITVVFLVDKSKWSVKIGAVDGGLQETSDVYKNIAPEAGYQSEATYHGNVSGRGQDNFDKNYYFKSRNGQVYGSLKMTIRPSADTDPDIVLSYVVNIEQGRELAVKPKE